MSELETVLAASERPAEGMEMRRKLIANHSEFHLEKRISLISSYESVIRLYNWNDCARGTTFPPLGPTHSGNFTSLESFTLSDDLDSRLQQEVRPIYYP